MQKKQCVLSVNGILNQSTTYDVDGKILSDVKKYSIDSYSYDDNNNIIKLESIGGNGFIKKYNAHNLVIYSKDDTGLECWYSYDAENRLVSSKSSDDTFYNVTYKNRGNFVISRFDHSDGYKETKKCISGHPELITLYVNSKGAKVDNEYDDRGRLINTFDGVTNRYFEYNDDGKLIHSFTDDDGTEYRRHYDCFGNMVKHEGSYGHTLICEYNEHNDIIKQVDNLGTVWEYGYIYHTI